MSLLCCVRGCRNGTAEERDPGAMFFPIPGLRRDQGPQEEDQGPQEEEQSCRRRMAWVSAVRITSDHVSLLSYVCSRHFHKGEPSDEALDTDPDWAPSLHLGHPRLMKPKKEKNTGIKNSRLRVEIAKQSRDTTATILIQHKCCVCGSRTHNGRGQRIRNGLAFFPFPKWEMSDLSKRQREAWVKAVGREDITFDSVPEEARVCSRHFISGNPADKLKQDDPDWTPSLHLKRNEPPKPRDVLLTTEESHLQELVRDKEQPMEPPPAADDTVQSFKDAFRNALKASLDACLDSSSQSSTEPRLSLDLSCFSSSENSPHSSLGGRSSPSVSPASETPCENCVRLQERITKLEERLAAPHFLQDHLPFTTWTPRPPSQTNPQAPGQGSVSPESHRPARKAKFNPQWLKLHWFLRYSPKLNVMWCHVCRLYEWKNNKGKTFVRGTRAFQTHAIKQHSRTSYHQECVEKFKCRNGPAQQ